MFETPSGSNRQTAVTGFLRGESNSPTLLLASSFCIERLGSGDGERKTPLTRQIAFEPLPASVLFGVHGWGPGCRRIHRSPAAIMTTATTPVGKIHFVMLPAVRDKYTSTLSPHRVVNQENQRGGVCFISLDSQVTLFLGRTRWRRGWDLNPR
jgi:hypothetical protein